MTDINKYNPYPEVCSIRCPNCQKEATFSFPFVLVSGGAADREKIQTETSPQYSLAEWGGWLVVVKFPDLFPWQPPSNGCYERDDFGVCSCPHCGHQSRHLLEWPQDAYFVCEVRGNTLWAWTRGHAQALKSYVESKDRKNYPGYFLFLRHIPKVFLLAKNRASVSKQLQRMLSA